MDRNGNGVIEPNEIQGRARGFIEGMARSAGMDPSRPMPISRLVGDRDRDRRSGRRDDDRDEKLYPAIPVFGDTLVPGFGVNPLTLNGQVVNLEERYDGRILRRVDRMLARYDANKNSLLDRSEWTRVRWDGDPNTFDTDTDGRMTKAELAEYYATNDDDDDDRRGGRGRGFDFFRRGGFDRDRDSGRFGSRGGDDDDDDNEGRRGRGRRRGGFGGRGGFGRFNPADMLARMDRNDDGSIEQDEMSDRARSMLDRFGIDTQRDIDLDEVRRRFDRGNSGDRDDRRSQSEEEQQSMKATLVNGSQGGRWSYVKRDDARAVPRGLPDWWDQSDQDNDGQVTMAEFLAGARRSEFANEAKVFSKYDINQDGTVTAREAEIYEVERAD